MTDLPEPVRETIEAELRCRIQRVSLLSGGMVNQAARLDTDTGSLFVKWRRQGLPSLFECEADGLERLRATATLRVPEVLLYRDWEECSPPFLVLEFIFESGTRDHKWFCARFAEGLARLHRENRSPFGGYGLEHGNYLGASPQRNTQTESWPQFYRDNRLIPQIEIARERDMLNTEREKLLGETLDRVEGVLGGYDSRPALIHGDLWSGNFLVCDDEPVLIDPAVSYSDREIEIAYVELFGGFPRGFVEEYGSFYPLEPGYQDRRPLHQLYPLLVHLNHFGETYGPAVDAVCRNYSDR